MKDEVLQQEQRNLDRTVSRIDNIIRNLRIQAERQRRFRNPIPGRESYEERIWRYEQAREKPYVGRLDWVEGNRQQSYYIGRTGISDDFEQEAEVLVVDWRTPIGDIYYSFHGGEGSYIVEDPEGGTTSIEVLLKRELYIEKLRVTKYRDLIGVRAIETGMIPKQSAESDYADDYLIELLRHTGADHQLKDIVATIQKEQNEIIRQSIVQPVLIQGVVGSGKSTVALHRLSYLLYRYGEQLKARRVGILAPNKMFLSYIQDLLPQLDISQVLQYTYITLAKELIPQLQDVQDVSAQLADIVEKRVDPDLLVKVLKYKSSLHLKKIIDRYLDYLEEQTYLSIPPLILDDECQLSREELQKRYDGYRHLPLEKRKRSFLESLENWVQDCIAKKTKELEDEFDDACRKWVEEADPGSAVRKQLYELLESIHVQKVGRYRTQVQKRWREYKKKWFEIHALDIYRWIFQKPLLQKLDPELDEELLEALDTYHAHRQSLGYEDLAPLLYIEDCLHGLPPVFDYLVIDEAQDLSPFQFYVLKRLTKSMTIAGDVTQSIYSFAGIEQWEELYPEVFNPESLAVMRMNISYRSTYEIVSVANAILRNSSLPYPEIVPILRHGEPVKVKRVLSDADLMEKIKDSITHFRHQGYQTIAIIHKDLRRSKALFERLRQSGYSHIQLIEHVSEKLSSPIVVIPSYLVKGLEFDAVIIPNADENNYPLNPLDAKLLFVAVTRAHHALHIFYNQKAPLLNGYCPEGEPAELESIL